MGGRLSTEQVKMMDEARSLRDEIVNIRKQARRGNKLINRVIEDEKITIVIDKGAPPTENYNFKQLDIIEAKDNEKSIEDHYYYDDYRNETAYSNKTTKRIMKEWKLLEESLPDSIYVKAYEARIDLLRAVIIGPSGTPYQDGLFFFDIQFPPDYPYQPPLFYYHSFGFWLNPRLYPIGGGVCISLLNTSSQGQETERWNPWESTILQVLVSIQTLILNNNPYGGQNEKSSDYNREVFPLTCQTMLGVLASPPNHFQEFVSYHFRCRAKSILETYKTYKKNWPSLIVRTTTIYQSIGIIYLRLHMGFIKNGWNFLREDKKDSNFLGDDVLDTFPGQFRLIRVFAYVIAVCAIFVWFIFPGPGVLHDLYVRDFS